MIIPGYRFFNCECGFSWKSTCRDYTSFSIESCDNCSEVSSPTNSEPHPEWKVDIYGTPIEKTH